MNLPLANIFSLPSGSGALFLAIGLTIVVGLLGVFAMTKMPTRLRRPVTAGITFLAGLYWVLVYFWPEAADRKPTDLPLNFGESIAFLLGDAQDVVTKTANTVTGFLLALGILSLCRVHIVRFVKRQKDWAFSGVLLASMLAMAIFGYWDWLNRLDTNLAGKLLDRSNWAFQNYMRDFLFDGLFQQMESTMFSLIAFFILSAAYRAFRIRSIEATILLATALIMIISLMGGVEFLVSQGIDNITGGDRSSFLNNFKLTEISQWMRSYIQNPGLRAIDFGIGIGALAMGLRLWLSLEKGGVGN